MAKKKAKAVGRPGELQQVPLEQLAADPANARKHPPEQLDLLAKSLERFGQRRPVVVRAREGGGFQLIAGHGVAAAARQLGWETIEALVVDDDDLTAAAFGLADNRLAELSHWQLPELNRSMRELMAEGEDPTALGFDESRLGVILRGAPKDEDPDDGRGRRCTEVLLVTFSPEQWATVRSALQRYRRERDSDATDTEAVARIAQLWVDEHGGDDDGEAGSARE